MKNPELIPDHFRTVQEAYVSMNEVTTFDALKKGDNFDFDAETHKAKTTWIKSGDDSYIAPNATKGYTVKSKKLRVIRK